jgi:hypothetical protein
MRPGQEEPAQPHHQAADGGSFRHDVVPQSEGYPQGSSLEYFRKALSLRPGQEEPGEEIVRKAGTLSKRVSGETIDWQERYATLTNAMMYIRRDKDTTEHMHEIDLLSITHVQRILDPEAGKLKRRFSITTDLPSRHEPGARSVINLRAASSIGMNNLQFENAFEIYVESHGMTYYFRASSRPECLEWVAAIQDAVRDAEEAYQRSLNLNASQRTRLAVRHAYEHYITQSVVSMLLLTNFAMSIVQGELAARDAQQLLEDLDVVDMVSGGW